jgi:hypothetical protein
MMFAKVKSHTSAKLNIKSSGAQSIKMSHIPARMSRGNQIVTMAAP